MALQADNIRRHSNRPTIPSKQSEQLNQISQPNNKSNTASVTQKENMAPDDPPAWITLAKGHILSHDLGKEWEIYVHAWFSLDEKLGFGSIAGTKVSILRL